MDGFVKNGGIRIFFYVILDISLKSFYLILQILKSLTKVVQCAPQRIFVLIEAKIEAMGQKWEFGQKWKVKNQFFHWQKVLLQPMVNFHLQMAENLGFSI